MSRARTRFTARYLRVLPRPPSAPGEITLVVSGVEQFDDDDDEIAHGKALAKLVEVTLNAAFLAFAKPRKSKKEVDPR